MKAYTIGKVAKMAGVSVRTLHHYDHIGLLEPTARSAAGYRLYEEPDLLRLQQILFYRELDLPLNEIRDVLDDPGFDPVEALRSHRRLLQKRAARLTRLLETIDKTIRRLEEDEMTLTDQELYEGFTEKQIERYKREAREMYGAEMVAETERRVKKMSHSQWKAVGAEGEAVATALAALTDKASDHPEVQALIARHHAWIENFYPCSAERYRGLGHLYTQHPEFRTYYDAYRPGLADFMQAAMAHYADHTLAAREV